MNISRCDNGLLFSSLMLLLIGLVMVASASINFADQQLGEPLYFFWRQLAYAGTGMGLALIALWIPIDWWQKASVTLLLFGMLLLLLVLTPGIGHEVNGSLRWIRLGPVNFQPSEPMKLFTILYMAGYLVRREHAVRSSFGGFVRPVGLVCIITGLMLLEPDYGAAVVLFATVLGMLFLAGVPMRLFLLWVMALTLALGLLILLAPYRLARLRTFMDPWADPFNSGFQLTQALIAIGRGELFGVGLGNSIQKLTYLPEAHTDFLFAILAEELGLLWVVVVIGLFAFMVMRTFTVGMRTERINRPYAAWMVYGIGLSIGLQCSINIGVNMGLLPTKGLTLPLMSYGGSSLVTICLMLGLLLRADYETRLLMTTSGSSHRRQMDISRPRSVS